MNARKWFAGLFVLFFLLAPSTASAQAMSVDQQIALLRQLLAQLIALKAQQVGTDASAYTGVASFSSPSGATTVSVGANLTFTYRIGTGAGDSATVERSIVNARTGATNSTYESITVSPGTYSFDWVPNEPGAYKPKLKVKYDGKTRTVRGPTVTAVGSPISVSDLETPELSTSLSRSSIAPGEKATLKWDSEGATRCFLQYDSVEEDIAVEGSKTVSPSKTTTYLISCTNDPGTGKDGPTAFEKEILTVKASGAPTCTLSASSEDKDSAYMDSIDTDELYVKPYGSVTLRWKTTSANYVVIGGDKGDTEGSITLDNLSKDTNVYTVTAYGSGGQATCTKTVYVNWKG